MHGADLLVQRRCMRKIGSGQYEETALGTVLLCRLESILVKCLSPTLRAACIRRETIERGALRPGPRQMTRFRILHVIAASDQAALAGRFCALAALVDALRARSVPAAIDYRGLRSTVVCAYPVRERALAHSLATLETPVLPVPSMELSVGLDACAVAVAASSATWPPDLAPAQVELQVSRHASPRLADVLTAALSASGITFELLADRQAESFAPLRIVISGGHAPIHVRSIRGEQWRVRRPDEAIDACREVLNG